MISQDYSPGKQTANPIHNIYIEIPFILIVIVVVVVVVVIIIIIMNTSLLKKKPKDRFKYSIFCSSFS